MHYPRQNVEKKYVLCYSIIPLITAMSKMIALGCYILLLFYGCDDHHESKEKSKQDVTHVRTAENLAQLIEANLGTSGTLRSDYEEAVAFIESNRNEESFSKQTISPMENLNQGYDTAYTAAREYWNKSRRTTATPLMTKFLVFCRLMRNAGQTTNEICREQLVRDATAAMEITLPYRVPRNRENSFDTLRFICLHLWKNENICREFPLRYILAIIIIHVNKTDPEKRDTKGFRVFEQFYRNLGFLDTEYKRCKTDNEKSYYKEYFDAIFRQLRRVHEPPPPNKCHDDLIDDILSQINTIDKQKRPLLQC